MGDFIGSTPFFVVMAVALAALIGLLLYLRKKQRDE